MKAILETRDLVKYYGKGDNLVKAIDHTDLIIEPGEFTANCRTFWIGKKYSSSYAGRIGPS